MLPMHDEPSRSRFSDLSTARQDQLVQAGVLVHVLDLHPVGVSVSELVRQMTLKPDHFGEEDAIKRAVYELAGVGLLHRHDYRNRSDALVAPTLAAVVAADLLADQGSDA
jgi:hypothetical protein